MNIYSPAIVGPTTSTSNYTGTAFIKSGGTSSQFLMADGSVITNPTSILITEHSNTDFDYTPVWSSGSALYITAAKLKFNPLLGRLSATSFLKIGGTSAQILTADGGIKVLGTGATDAAAGNHLHTGVYEPVITAGTTAQYWRGDKSWQTFPTIPTVTPSALTRTNDTNVTLTLGGTPTTALLQATSITVGWTGTLADARITSAATWNAKEPGLGNPTVSGYVLSSTTAGVRSWVAMTGGSDTYPTTFTWTGGTTAGPTGSLTGTSPTVSFAAIPAASNTTSGIITTGAQTLTGNKTFSGNTTISVGGGIALTLAGGGLISQGDIETSTGFKITGGLGTQYLMANGTVTTSNSSLPYLVYVAILNQAGTAAPTATIVSNTLGGTPTWAYSTTGGYTCTLTGAFTASKTTIFYTNGQASNAIFGCYRITSNVLSLTCVLSTTAVPSNDLIWNGTIEIRVYP